MFLSFFLKKIFFLFFLFFSFPLFANIENMKIHSSRCLVTKGIYNAYEPEIFSLSNNLFENMKNGFFTTNNLHKVIIIRGKILDKNCLPVSDAKIYLWQHGPDGKYPYKLKNKSLARKNTNTASDFKGNGIASSNNLGEFYFITLAPMSFIDHSRKTHIKTKPFVSIRIEHSKLGKLQTNLTLSENNLITEYDKDEMINIYKNAIDNIEAVYNFDLVMPGFNDNRSF